MLRTCNRLLVALILVLMATASVSTMAHASGVASPNGSSSSSGSGLVKPAPVPTSGEPDQPDKRPPPPSYVNTGPALVSPDGTPVADGWLDLLIRFGRIWEILYLRTTP